MTIALGLLSAAVLIGLLGPMYLRSTVSPRVRPGVALTGWVASVLVVTGAATAAAVLLSLPHNAAADTILGMATVCINTGDHLWETILRLSATILLLGAAARVMGVALRMSKRGHTHRRQHLAALKLLSHADPQPGGPLFWLPESAPVAYSLGGRTGAIVVTTGVAHLEPDTRAAILAHERAHLRGRHHGLVLMAEVMARALPFVPLFRAASPAVRVLVELSADAAAARTCGTDRVRAALRAAAPGIAPTGSLAISGEAVEMRMRWLTPVHRTPYRKARDRAGYAAAALASLTPALAGIGAVAGLVLLWCLTLDAPI